jgi:2-methylcitrate dehydratase
MRRTDGKTTTDWRCSASFVVRGYRRIGSMKLARRKFLGLAAGALSVPAAGRALAQPSQPLAERLAGYADGLRFSDIDPATVERVKAHVIDALGCGIAAFDERPVKASRDIALAGAAGTATVIGTGLRASPELATFANGAAVRYFDLNDVYASPSGAVHPSDHVAPCLAVAEAERANGAELVTAIVIAYEINCRLADASDAMTRGWDAPVFSLPAVALAAGKLMKLSPNQLVQAVNLAINDHIPMGQTRTQANSDWKGLADAEAGRNAVFAAMLARGGVTGPEPIFEGRKGFFQMVSAPAEVDVGTFGGRRGSFLIHQCGMKAYPAVVYAQTAIVAGLMVAKEVSNLDTIAAIEIATSRRGYEQAGRDQEKWSPRNRDTADHSLPYITARAMLDGDISNESYAAEKLRDPRVLALMSKTTVKEDPAFATSGGNAPPTRVTAIFKDGRRIAHQVDHMPGFPGKPMTRADVERKFRSNLGTRTVAEETGAVLQTLWALDRTDDVRSLTSKLALRA